eukprot:g63671.t1
MEKLMDSTLKSIMAVPVSRSGEKQNKVFVPEADRKIEGSVLSKEQKKLSSNLSKIIEIFREYENKQDEARVRTDSGVAANRSAAALLRTGSGVHPETLSQLDPLLSRLTSGDLPLLIFSRMAKMPLESCTSVLYMYTFVLRNRREAMSEYVLKHPQILHMLVDGYRDQSISITCGGLLREMIRDEAIHKIMLEDEHLWEPFVEFVNFDEFTVASDAFDTLKGILTKHPKLTGEWLHNNREKFVKSYNGLVLKGKYVVKRQALKLLGEILTTRTNFHFMMAYIKDPEQLEFIISCFSGREKATKYEAFHIFKIFIANPQKPDAVVKILRENKEPLALFL